MFVDSNIIKVSTQARGTLTYSRTSMQKQTTKQQLGAFVNVGVCGCLTCRGGGWDGSSASPVGVCEDGALLVCCFPTET